MLVGSYIEAYGSGTTFGRCGSSVSQRRKNGRSPELAFSSRRISSLAPQASRDWSGVISRIHLAPEAVRPRRRRQPLRLPPRFVAVVRDVVLEAELCRISLLIHLPFADVAEIVAGGSQRLAPGRQTGTQHRGRLQVLVADHAMPRRPDAGHQRGARWTAHRAGAERVAERDAFADQAVQVRRANQRMPVAADAIVAVLVGLDEENVGLWHEIYAFSPPAVIPCTYCFIPSENNTISGTAARM